MWGSFTPLEFENWHFPIKFLAKSRFLSFERVKWIFVTLPFPWKKIFGYAWNNRHFAPPPWKNSLGSPWIWLHQSTQPYVVRLSASFKKEVHIFHNIISTVGMLHWTWWVLTLAPHGRLYRAPNLKLQATDYLTIFGQYLVRHYFAALDGKRYLLSARFTCTHRYACSHSSPHA